MICLATLKRSGISLQSLLRSRDHVATVTTCSLLRSRDTATTCSLSRSRDTPIPSSLAYKTRHGGKTLPSGPTISKFLSTSSAVGKPKSQRSKVKKKKDIIVLYQEKRDKSPLYLSFFTGLPLAMVVSGVVPYFVRGVGEIYPDGGFSHTLCLAAPSALLAAAYSIVIMWGLRFPRKMELTKDMRVKLHIVKWPGYKACVDVDPSRMRIHREDKKVYSMAREDLVFNYTLNKKWGTIERRDILDKLFGKYDPKKDIKLSQQLKDKL